MGSLIIGVSLADPQSSEIPRIESQKNIFITIAQREEFHALCYLPKRKLVVANEDVDRCLPLQALEFRGLFLTRLEYCFSSIFMDSRTLKLQDDLICVTNKSEGLLFA